jgi:hypothetical protein
MTLTSLQLESEVNTSSRALNFHRGTLRNLRISLAVVSMLSQVSEVRLRGGGNN